MEKEQHNSLEGVLASLDSDQLDRLAELVVTKLAGKNDGSLPSKQVVASSSLVSRSNRSWLNISSIYVNIDTAKHQRFIRSQIYGSVGNFFRFNKASEEATGRFGCFHSSRYNILHNLL